MRFLEGSDVREVIARETRERGRAGVHGTGRVSGSGNVDQIDAAPRESVQARRVGPVYSPQEPASETALLQIALNAGQMCARFQCHGTIGVVRRGRTRPRRRRWALVARAALPGAPWITACDGTEKDHQHEWGAGLGRADGSLGSHFPSFSRSRPPPATILATLRRFRAVRPRSLCRTARCSGRRLRAAAERVIVGQTTSWFSGPPVLGYEFSHGLAALSLRARRHTGSFER